MLNVTLKPDRAANAASRSPVFRHILVAIDGSEHSTWAADAAGRLARDLGSKLTLLHVAAVPMILAGEIGYVRFPPTADTRDDGEEMLGRAAAKVPPGVEVEQLMHEGDAGCQIVAAAKDVGADLIMMGRHAKGPLARMILGSVADYVVRHAPCPVLTMSHPASVARMPPMPEAGLSLMADDTARQAQSIRGSGGSASTPR